MNVTPHFTQAELACRHCGMLRFHPGFLAALEDLRVQFARPMAVLSGCRCKAHNDRPAAEGGAGGHVRSLHVCDREQHPGQQGALGIDIAATDGAYRGALFVRAWHHGWSIGWNAKRGFLHLDRRDYVGLPQTTFDY